MTRAASLQAATMRVRECDLLVRDSQEAVEALAAQKGRDAEGNSEAMAANGGDEMQCDSAAMATWDRYQC